MACSRITTALAVICAAIGLVRSMPAVAGEIEIYESLSDVDIGRVFLSPEQRAYLDARPVMSPQQVIEPAPTEPVERKKKSAGYFTSSAGVSSVWSQGGFVTDKDARVISFPGDVQVTRKEPAQTDFSNPSSIEIPKPASSDKEEAADDGA